MIQNKLKIIAITGISGSGKSTASEILKKYGAYTIDADNIAHNVMRKQSPCYHEIIDIFGNKILDFDSNIDRKILAQIVFNDENLLNILNSITHKYVFENIRNKISNVDNKKYKFIVLDIPILINTEFVDEVDYIWVICSEYEQIIKRLQKRDFIDSEHIDKRLKNQSTLEEFLDFADILIYNTKTKDDLEKEILDNLKNIII